MTKTPKASTGTKTTTVYRTLQSTAHLKECHQLLQLGRGLQGRKRLGSFHQLSVAFGNYHGPIGEFGVKAVAVIFPKSVVICKPVSGDLF